MFMFFMQVAFRVSFFLNPAVAYQYTTVGQKNEFSSNGSTHVKKGTGELSIDVMPHTLEVYITILNIDSMVGKFYTML